MTTLSDALWEINNEYRKQLSLLMGHMKLLEELLKMQGNAEPALRAAIRRVRATLEDVDADHHGWRHTYYYQIDGEQRRRMVNGEAKISRALETFSDMFSEHLRDFEMITETMAGLPRPDPALTRVIKGSDLWQMCLDELETLATFDKFVNDRLSGKQRFF